MKNIVNTYKTPLLISLTLAVVLTALPVLKNPITIGLVFFTCFVGTFVLDLDYIIYAYFTDTEKNFSKDLRAFIKHKDFTGAINHINMHKQDLQDKTLNSALFQSTLVIFGIFVLYSDAAYPVKTLVLAIIANSLYKALEAYFTGQTNDWFWAFKTKPNKTGFRGYLLVISTVFIYCLTLV